MKTAALLALSVLCVSAVQAQPKPVATSTILARPTITATTLNAKQLTDVQNLVKGMNPASYSLVITQAGKAPIRLGNAAIKDLSTVSVWHAPGSVVNAANEIATSVDNYIKVVWTSSVAGADRQAMEKVNSILGAPKPLNVP